MGSADGGRQRLSPAARVRKVYTKGHLAKRRGLRLGLRHGAAARGASCFVAAVPLVPAGLSPLERRPEAKYAILPAARGAARDPGHLHRAFVVIDIQEGYYSKNPSVRDAFPFFRQNVVEALRLARTSGAPGTPAPFDLIVHVRAGYALERGSSFLPEFGRLNPEKRVVAPGSPDAAPEDFARAPFEEPDTTSIATAPAAPPEIVLVKPTFDGFLQTELEAELQRAGIREVFMIGLVTSVCVHTTAHGAFARGYQVVLLEDCLGDRSRERHESTLALYGGYMYRLATVADLQKLVQSGH